MTAYAAQFARTFVPGSVPAEPERDWSTVAVELLGAQTRFVVGRRWTHRIIEQGEGVPLLLLHGVGGHAEVWSRNISSLASRGFRVIAADALYHGLSSKEPYDDHRRYELQVEAVIDLLDALGVDRVHIEGESMGATIAFHLGMTHPERVGKLVLNTGFGHVALGREDFIGPSKDYAELARLSERVLLDPSRASMRARLEWVVADPDAITDEMVDLRMRLYADPAVNESMRRVFRIGGTWDWDLPYTESDCSTFQPSTLVLWTDQNPGQGPDFGDYVASLLPRGRFYCIEGAAHWPQWERPHLHDHVVASFLLAAD